MASPGFGVRGHEDRGAEGASIEAAKAPSGVGYGEGCPLPSRLGGLGERRELPSGVRDGSPATVALHFLHISGHRTLLVARKIRFSCPKYKEKLEKVKKVVVTVTTTFSGGGDKSPSSHTKLRLCSVLSMYLTLFSKRQQRCELLLSILHQLV